MAHIILKDPLFAVGRYDLSGDLSEGSVEVSADEVDDTRFGVGTRTVIGGLKSVNGSLSGRWEGGEGNVDDALFSKLSVADEPFSVTPTRDGGDVAYLMKSVVLEYSPGAAIGDRFDFDASINATGDIIRGRLLHDDTETATGNSTAVQVGAVGADETLYAALHVISASGTTPTLDVTVDSDDASGFSSGVTRITFDQATAEGSQWKSLGGAVADDWFRINFTIGGTSPSFTFVVTIGIL